MNFARPAALILALLACAACASQTAMAPPPPPDPKTQMAALELRIFDLVQNERQKIDPKAKTLSLDSELVGVARRRSEDMAAKNYMAHQGPDGQTSASVLMDEDSDFQGLLGENIAAQHFTKQGGVDVEAFAQRFVKTWLDSADHKENLSFAAYDRSGVGAAVSGDTVYVTQLFATDLGLHKHATDPKARQITSLDHPKTETSAPDAPLRGAIIPVPRPAQPNASP
jgi:uncharacterized protein YkwD